MARPRRVNASYSSIPVAIYRIGQKCLKNIDLAKDIIFLEKKVNEKKDNQDHRLVISKDATKGQVVD